ncbi:MAG: hypothetical protein ABI923_04930 [bacterium]
MQRHLKFYSVVIVLVVLFDVVGSIASRIFQFDYTKLFWVSWCIYFIAGFIGYKRLGLLGGIAAGFVAGLGDATLGWFVSTAIGPYLPNRPQQPYGIVIVMIAILIVSILGAFFGLIEAVVSKLLTRDRSSTAAEQALERTRHERVLC